MFVRSNPLLSFAFFVILFFGCLLCSLQAQAQANVTGNQLTIPARVLPLSPKEVLALLPPTPPGWKVTTSTGTNQIGSWLVTITQRQIEAPAPDTPSSVGTTSRSTPAMRTTFMLIDSGYDPSASGAFVDFKAGRNGSVEKAFLQNYPIIRTRASATSESLQMLINRRFVFRVDAENQAKDAVLQWVQQLPFARYNLPATATLTALPSQVVIRSVDELNPRNDQESKINVASPTPLPR